MYIYIYMAYTYIYIYTFSLSLSLWICPSKASRAFPLPHVTLTWLAYGRGFRSKNVASTR